MTSPQPVVFQNAILRSLRLECIERLRLRPVRLEADQRIATAGDPVQTLLFIESGCIALGVPLEDGSIVDTGAIGHRSISGAPALLGPRSSLHHASVRSPGSGLVCSLEHAEQEFARGGEFHDLALACLHAQLAQSSQLAACNRHHDAEQRLCRWLLHCQHESGGEVICATHETLAEALGVRRTTVTLMMHVLRKQGAIEYSRGRIRLTDPAVLEALTCECFEVLRQISKAADPMRLGWESRKGPHALPASDHATRPLAGLYEKSDTEQRQSFTLR